MKFVLKRASELPLLATDKTETVEIRSLKDLENLQKEEGYPVIVDFNNKEVTVYDGNLE